MRIPENSEKLAIKSHDELITRHWKRNMVKAYQYRRSQARTNGAGPLVFIRSKTVLIQHYIQFMQVFGINKKTRNGKATKFIKKKTFFSFLGCD
jgi:hypothetical protein